MFEQDEAAYLAWLAAHPEGFVVNTTRPPKPGYMVLHKADCHTISQYTRNAREGGFTERQYLKVCAPTVGALAKWTAANGRPGSSFSKRCQVCGA